MISEKTVRENISEILAETGYLTIGEAKKAYSNIYANQLSQRDKRTLPSSDTTPRFEKIIGNIVSHQYEDIKYYEEGFILDKSARPAVFAYADAPVIMTLLDFARIQNPAKRTVRK